MVISFSLLYNIPLGEYSRVYIPLHEWPSCFWFPAIWIGFLLAFLTCLLICDLLVIDLRKELPDSMHANVQCYKIMTFLSKVIGQFMALSGKLSEGFMLFCPLYMNHHSSNIQMVQPFISIYVLDQVPTFSKASLTSWHIIVISSWIS